MATPTTAPPLSPDSIARAAELIASREGLAALTMRRLGRELGVEAMSIYHHVPNKAALEKILVERLIARSRPAPPALPADELLETVCREFRVALLARPNLAPLLTEHLPGSLFDSPNSASARASLLDSGFDESAAAWILDAFLAFVVGHVIIELTDDHSTDDHDAAFETGLRFLLAGLREELGF